MAEHAKIRVLLHVGAKGSIYDIADRLLRLQIGVYDKHDLLGLSGVKAIDGADDLCQGGSDIAVHRFVVQHRELFIIIADIGAQRGVLRAEEATDLVQSGGTAGFVFFDDGI